MSPILLRSIAVLILATQPFATTAFGQQPPCLARQRTLLAAPLTERLDQLAQRKEIQRVTSQSALHWSYVPLDHLETYVDAVRNDTIEIVQFEEHIAIRIDNVLYHQVLKGVRTEPFTPYIRKMIGEKKKHVVGFGLHATREEIRAVRAYFEAKQGSGNSYSQVLNNCSQNVCRALDHAKTIDGPGPFGAILPSLTGRFFAQSPRTRYAITYFEPTPELPDPADFVRQQWIVDVGMFGGLVAVGVFTVIYVARDYRKLTQHQPDPEAHSAPSAAELKLVRNCLDQPLGSKATIQNEQCIARVANFMASHGEGDSLARGIQAYAEAHRAEIELILVAQGWKADTLKDRAALVSYLRRPEGRALLFAILSTHYQSLKLTNPAAQLDLNSLVQTALGTPVQTDFKKAKAK